VAGQGIQASKLQRHPSSQFANRKSRFYERTHARRWSSNSTRTGCEGPTDLSLYSFLERTTFELDHIATNTSTRFTKRSVQHIRPQTSPTKPAKMSIPALDKLPFTLQCLPFGVISTTDSEPRCAVAIGDHAIDLARYAQAGRLIGVGDGNKSGVEFESVFKQVSVESDLSEKTSPAPIGQVIRQLEGQHRLTYVFSLI